MSSIKCTIAHCVRTRNRPANLQQCQQGSRQLGTLRVPTVHWLSYRSADRDSATYECRVHRHRYTRPRITSDRRYLTFENFLTSNDSRWYLVRQVATTSRYHYQSQLSAFIDARRCEFRNVRLEVLYISSDTLPSYLCFFLFFNRIRTYLRS